MAPRGPMRTLGSVVWVMRCGSLLGALPEPAVAGLHWPEVRPGSAADSAERCLEKELSYGPVPAPPAEQAAPAAEPWPKEAVDAAVPRLAEPAPAEAVASTAPRPAGACVSFLRRLRKCIHLSRADLREVDSIRR